MERSVRRSELDAPSTASSPVSVDLDRLKGLHEFDLIETTPQQTADTNIEEDELTFRLFASTKSEAPQTIRLKSPTPESKEPSFITPRDPSYYFSSSRPAQLQAAAVSFADIQKLASIRWTGSACPWKVLQLPASDLSKTARSTASTLWTKLLPEETTRRRRRLGKKARIKLRTKLAEARDKSLAAKAAQESHEAAEREKKTRRNREKKAKKRLRDKLKKSSDPVEDVEMEEHSDGSAD